MKKPSFVMNYTPFRHQWERFQSHKDAEFDALLWEMGTGKTKAMLDKAGYLFSIGKVKALLIVAPNGVHRDHINYACKDHVSVPYFAAYWAASPIKKERKQLEWLSKIGDNRLKILSMNTDALRFNSRGWKFAMDFCRNNDVLVVIDEFSDFKNIRSLRAKGLLGFRSKPGIAKYANYRMIMDGTPINQSPCDIFVPFQFLKPGLLGFSSFVVFRSRYEKLWSPSLVRDLTIIVKDKDIAKIIATMRCDRGKVFEDDLMELIPNDKTRKYVADLCWRAPIATGGYRNLEELAKKIEPYSDRRLKSECLDLPDKIFVTMTYDMSSLQKHMYTELKKKLYVEINDSMMSAAIVIIKYLRLQQILGGFYKLDDGDTMLPIEGANPRLELLIAELKKLSINVKVIVWAGYKCQAELEMIYKRIQFEFGRDSVVHYYGETSNNDKDDAKYRMMNDPLCRFFVSSSAGAVGLDCLVKASYMFFYSHDFKLRIRLQSIDRGHRTGQVRNLTVIDIRCPGTMDDILLQSYRDKKKISDMVLQDPLVMVR